MSPSPQQSPANLARPSSPPISSTSNAAHDLMAASNSAQHPPSQPRLASLADAGLKAATPLKPLKNSDAPNRIEPPVLTGAAAMADEQRLKEDAKRHRQQLQSPNPALASLNGLRGGPHQPMSQASDTTRLSPMTAAISPAPNRLLTPVVPDAVQMEQNSPTSMSSHEELHHQAYHAASSRGRRLSASKAEERTNKALTYPPQPPVDPQTPGPTRGMSLPNAESRKSSAVKKHKCPHCATEFTRHHNLKSHLLTHSQEKPYGCQQCSAKFRRLHDLKRHTKLHTGERPHTCNKCGRRFARGDALARHNKGPGGCAGRRGSFDEDGFGEGASAGDDAMDDVVYGDQSQSGEPSGSSRRRSEPGQHQDTTTPKQTEASVTSYRQHSSTYPGVAAMSGGARAPQVSSNRLNSRSSAASHSSAHFNGPPSYSQGSMTESPRPLSPAQIDSHRQPPLQEPHFYERSSSATKPIQPQQIGRGLSQGSSSMNLPPLGPQAPQLPPISGLVQDGQRAGLPRSSASSSLRGPPPMVSTHLTASQGPNSANSTTGSVTSSHHQSSGGSLRDNIGSVGNQTTSSNQNESALLDIIQRMREEINTQRAQHSSAIARLQEENQLLRSQLQHQQQQQHQHSHQQQ